MTDVTYRERMEGAASGERKPPYATQTELQRRTQIVWHLMRSDPGIHPEDALRAVVWPETLKEESS